MTTIYTTDDVCFALYALAIQKEAWARGLPPETAATDVTCYARGPRIDEEETQALRAAELAAYQRGVAILAEARLVFSQRFAWGEMIPGSGSRELGEVDSPVHILDLHCADGRAAVQFVALRSRERDLRLLSEWLGGEGEA